MMSPVKETPQINNSEGRREEGQSDERNKKTTERMERREGGERKRNKDGRKEWRE